MIMAMIYGTSAIQWAQTFFHDQPGAARCIQGASLICALGTALAARLPLPARITLTATFVAIPIALEYLKRSKEVEEDDDTIILEEGALALLGLFPSSKRLLPRKVWDCLCELFKDSPYPAKELPLYSSGLLKDPSDIDIDRMASPVMVGFRGSNPDDPLPFIAIRVQNEKEQTALIVLGQYGASDQQFNPACWGENGWFDLSAWNILRFFRPTSITSLVDGSGPVEDQKENFKNFQAFLKAGIGKDLSGVTWQIQKNPQ